MEASVEEHETLREPADELLKARLGSHALVIRIILDPTAVTATAGKHAFEQIQRFAGLAHARIDATNVDERARVVGIGRKCLPRPLQRALALTSVNQRSGPK